MKKEGNTPTKQNTKALRRPTIKIDRDDEIACEHCSDFVSCTSNGTTKTTNDTISKVCKMFFEGIFFKKNSNVRLYKKESLFYEPE
jgi:hypothetical protein